MVVSDVSETYEISSDGNVDGILVEKVVPSGELWYVEEAGVNVKTDGTDGNDVEIRIVQANNRVEKTIERTSGDSANDVVDVDVKLNNGGKIIFEETADFGGSDTLKIYAKARRLI